MRTEIDSFSGNRIYPGRGKLYVRGDSKVFRFVSSKSASLFLQRKNPRRISWTVLYRRMHKKGVTEEVTKKRTRRTVKHQRAIVGASLEVIKEKRSIRPEARKAARSESIALAKEKKKADDAKKKAEKAKLAAAGKTTAAGAKFSKQQMKGAAPKVTARSR
ncbi:ribosomal protein L24e-domain-containing protein [Lipomyces doorenjongii]